MFCVVPSLNVPETTTWAVWLTEANVTAGGASVADINSWRGAGVGVAGAVGVAGLEPQLTANAKAVSAKGRVSPSPDNSSVIGVG